MSETRQDKQVTRRSFLRFAAVVVGAGATLPLLTACGQQAAPAPAPAPTTPPAQAPQAAATPTQAPAAPKPAEKIALKFGHVLAPTEPIHQSAEAWGKKVAELTGGQVTIEVFPSSTLGNNRDTYEQALLGAPVLGHTDPGYMMDYVPDFGVLNGPFIVENFQQFDKIIASELFEDLQNRLIGKGLRILAFNWAFGQRHLISDKPIPNPDAMKGMKFRVPPNQMWVETIRAMGGTPTPLEWAEVYSGLAQGVVDGAEAPLSTLWGSKLFEVKKVITLTGHFKALTGIVVGDNFWKTLPEDVRKIVQEEAVNHGKLATKQVLASEQDWRKKLETEGGVTFAQSDVAAYQKATEIVYTKFPEWTPGLHDKVKAILNA